MISILCVDKNKNQSLLYEQHKKIIELINNACTVEKLSNRPNNVLGILNEMTEYALKYFETEERYMKTFNFPEYQNHRKEHIAFTNTVIDYKNRVVGGDKQIARDTLKYLIKWHANHIQVTDKKYIDFFKTNDLK